jgi:hypothetical protein
MAGFWDFDDVAFPEPDLEFFQDAIGLLVVTSDGALDIPYELAKHLLHEEEAAPGPPGGAVCASSWDAATRDPAAAISIRRHNRSLHATRMRNAVQRRHDLRRAVLSQSLPQSASLASHSVAAPGWAGSGATPGARPMNCQREKRLPMRRTMASAVLRAAAVKRTRELHEHMLAAY